MEEQMNHNENTHRQDIQTISDNPQTSVAGWTAYLLPYSAIHRNEHSSLKITLEQVNTNSYEGSKLSEIVSKLPLYNSDDMTALVSYDGAIVVPQCENLPNKSKASEELNNILCSILLGGIHTEAAHPSDIGPSILDNGARFCALWPCVHGSLRNNWAGIAERMEPLIFPRVLMASELTDAFAQGRTALKAIPSLYPFFLLSGYTSMIYQNTNDALSNLWIAIEQITEHLWEKNYTPHKNSLGSRVAKFHKKVKGSRTKIDDIYSKHKILRYSKIISNECYTNLNEGR